MSEIVGLPLSLVPVLAFLAALFFLESYRLVRFRAVLEAILAGAVAAAACFLLARWLIGRGLVDAGVYARVAAPAIEEAAKAVFVVVLIRREWVGFMVDAAIFGFAIGAGFALVENVYFLTAVEDPSPLLWCVRGFGTAVMHGGATAIVAIVSKALSDLRRSERLWVFLPGFCLAAATHAAFNQFALPPLLETLVVMIAFPALIAVVFSRSERLLQGWLEVGFGSDVELLEMIKSGELKDTKVGEYLLSLQSRFPREVLGDMLSYLQLRVELALKAKAILIVQKAGMEPAKDPEIGDRFKELRYLERSLGVTGKLALSPFLHTSTRDLWQLHMLQENAAA